MNENPKTPENPAALPLKKFAITSIVLGVLGGYPGTWLLGIVGLALAFYTLRVIKTQQIQLEVKKLALAGLILSLLSSGLGLTLKITAASTNRNVNQAMIASRSEIDTAIRQYNMAMNAKDYQRASMLASQLENYYFRQSREREYQEWRTKTARARELATESFFNRTTPPPAPRW